MWQLARGRSRRLAHADRVVLAAGGLGSPMLLRASGIDRAGRDYFYDPVLAITGTLPGLDAGVEPPMLGAAHLDAEGYMLTDLCRPQWLHNTLAVAAGRPDRALGFRSQASVMVKARDELSGAMTRFGSPGKPLTAADRAVLERGSADARAILTRAGALSIYQTSHVAVHPGGTAKVGDVVDANLQTEIDGLFVCDASVIPIPWGLPPTFTVMSLARRLARHLSGSVFASPHVG